MDWDSIPSDVSERERHRPNQKIHSRGFDTQRRRKTFTIGYTCLPPRYGYFSTARCVMSRVTGGGREPAVDSGDSLTSSERISTDDSISSCTGLDADFAESCAVEDPRGQINLTYSQLNDGSHVKTTETIDGDHKELTGIVLESVVLNILKTEGSMGLLQSVTSKGLPTTLSYAGVTTLPDEINHKAMPLAIKRAEQMTKIAIGPQHFDLLKLIGDCTNLPPTILEITYLTV